MLESLFIIDPGNVEGWRCRNELKRYATVHPFRSGPNFLPASLRVSKGNCSHCTGVLGYSKVLTVLKRIKVY